MQVGETSNVNIATLQSLEVNAKLDEITVSYS